MKKSSIAASIVLAALTLAPLAAQAQNIAVVNGKPVPKSRVDTIVTQVQKQAAQRNQQVPPDLEKMVRDKVVTDEILSQEAERRGLGATPEFKAQMELARQSILIGLLSQDIDKKSTVSDADVQKEYDKFKAQATGTEYKARHILVEKEEDAKALIAKIKAGEKFEDLAKKSSKDPGSAPNGGDLDFAAPGLVRARVLAGDGQAEERRVHARAGEDPVRLSHHQAGRHARRAVPGARRREAADPAAPGPGKGRRVPRRAARQGEDGLQVHQLSRRSRGRRRLGEADPAGLDPQLPVAAARRARRRG